MRLLTPIVALGAPGRNARISAQMAEAIEAAKPATSGVAVTA
jgi:hypothetical protein